MSTLTFSVTDGTELSAAYPAWSKHPSYTLDLLFYQNRIRLSSSSVGSSCYFWSESPASADYYVESVIYFREANGGTSSSNGIALRISSSLNTMYFARYSNTNVRWELYKLVNGTSTLLGNYSQSITSGSTPTVRLEAIGSDLKFYVNGTLRISASDSSITAPGYAGVRFLNSSNVATNTNQTQIGTTFSRIDIAVGTLSATEPNADQFSAASPDSVTGSLSANESTGDSLSATGSLIAIGTMAVSESGADDFQASGEELDAPEGSMAVTESGADTFASSGTLVVTTSGSMAASESTTDTFSAASPSEQVTNYLGLKVFPFPPNWSQSLTETLEWRTDVLTAYNGKEQRRALRVLPRRGFEYSFIVREVNARRLESLIYGWQDGPVILPVWTDRMKSTAAVNAGSKIIPMSTATYGVRVGDPITIYDSPGIFEVHQVKTFTSSQVELETGLVRSWPIGSSVYPSVVAHMPAEIQLKRETDRLVQGSVLFTTSPDDTYAFTPDEAATELYGGVEVLYKSPNWIDGLDNTFNREYLIADAGVGAVQYFRKEQFMKMTRPYKWFLRSRAEILAFRKFLTRMRGRSKTCWIPSWHDDFTLASPVSSSSFIITVVGLDFFRLYAEDKSRTNLMFKTVAGQRYYRSILSVSQLGENSAITMNSPLPVNLTIVQMASINFLLRCRLATDKIDIPWQTDTFADPQTTFTSVPA